MSVFVHITWKLPNWHEAIKLVEHATQLFDTALEDVQINYFPSKGEEVS